MLYNKNDLKQNREQNRESLAMDNFVQNYEHPLERFLEHFEKDELLVLKELGIDPGDLVFEKRSLLSSKTKLFVCHLQFTDGLYSFVLPEKLPRIFKKQIAQTSKKLLCVNNSYMRRVMQSAKKNAEFVERFNGELFFRHSSYQGRRLNTKELFEFYETDPYFKIINLSSAYDKQPFIALFALAFHGCTVQDLYTIDGIFSMQPEREADNAKKSAGNDVFNLILRNDRAEIDNVLLQMGQTLLKLQPPRVNLGDTGMLAKNYTLFIGLSEMARVYMRTVQSIQTPQAEQTVNAANTLMNYAPLVQLCNSISTLTDYDDFRESGVYKKCVEIFG